MAAKKYKPGKSEGFIERRVSGFMRSLAPEPARKQYSWHESSRVKRRTKVAKHARLFHVRYGNLVLVIIGVAAGAWILLNPDSLSFLTQNTELGLLGAFVLGLLYPTGVTTPASIAGFFLLGKSINPAMLALVGSAGALITDVLIFYFIRHKLVDYLDKVANKFVKTNMYVWRHRVMNHPRLKYFIPLMAGFLIASPLPTEIAIGIFAAIKFDMKRFVIYAFVFHTFSIFMVSMFGEAYHI